MSLATVLTIAGFDPSSGAGVTADLAVFAAHGLFGCSCITALTVQSTLGVAAVHPVGADIVRATLDHLEADLPPDGIKIGMLGTAAVVRAVAGYLESLYAAGRRPVVVLDPVLRSTSGRRLLDADGMRFLLERLLPRVDWVTPNLEELRQLNGGHSDPAAMPGREPMLQAARTFLVRHPGVGLMVTGGDQDPPDDLVLAHPSQVDWLVGKRVETRATHGTGCALSSALLCRLVMGDEPLLAARRAKEYVAEALRRAQPIGHGHGPLNLLWSLRASAEP